MTPAQRAQIVAILEAANDFTIATIRADGYPQATTVSFVSDGLNLYFGTWSKSQKSDNIAHCDKVSVVVDLPYKSWNEIKGLSIGARARKIEAADEAARVGTLMLKKFPQLTDFDATMGADMALFAIEPEVISILDYSQGFGHTELVRLNA